jgi:3-keto-disaccharide hydrolase
MKRRTLFFAPLALVLGVAANALVLAARPTETIFNGKSPAHWLTNTGKPLPAANVQPDGLNPHKSGGYIVVFERPLRDFELSFDYKLTPGCNSGVFLRTGDLKDPVMSGIEIAIDDTKGTGMHDPGAFYDLVPPKVNAQKPAGEWNHMSIDSRGPRISVTLNGQKVSEINLDEWTEPGTRPDGSKHKFTKVRMKDMNREGYFGFQDHGSDCWFKNVVIHEPD